MAMTGSAAPPTGAPASAPTSRGLLALVVAVFFLFGGITNLSDVLIPKLKGLFQLTYAEAMLVQFAFFTSYAVFSMPAGQLMARLGYARGVVAGFAVMALACLLFIPAARSGSFPPFLLALFMLGGGITLLQVGVNPLIVALGPPATAHSRLTFAQFFNSLGVFLMVRIGAEAILGDAVREPASTDAAVLTAFRAAETRIIGEVYLGIAVALVAIAAVFWLSRDRLAGGRIEAVRFRDSFALLRRPRLAWGVAAIFAYVGAEVAIASLLINYLGEARVLGLAERPAGVLLSYYWLGALIGRMLGGFLLRALRPGPLLAAFAAAAIALIAASALTSGPVAAWTLIAVGLFNSIMFPTIFSLAIEGCEREAAQASGLLCTAIVGGAVIPVLTGLVADGAGLAAALAVPAACYVLIAAYGLMARRSLKTAAP